MAKMRAKGHGPVELQFSTRILYSSPPEVSSLSAWVREVESKHDGSVSKSQKQPDKDQNGQERGKDRALSPISRSPI